MKLPPDHYGQPRPKAVDFGLFAPNTIHTEAPSARWIERLYRSTVCYDWDSIVSPSTAYWPMADLKVAMAGHRARALAPRAIGYAPSDASAESGAGSPCRVGRDTP